MKATFGGWLARQARRDDPIGDLASDFKLDPDHKEYRSVREVLAHLDNHQATDEVYDVFDQAVTEWSNS